MIRRLIKRTAESATAKPVTFLGGLSAVAIVALGAVLIANALAGPPPPPPKPHIDSKPSNPSYSTPAVFTYSDDQSVTFQCSFEGGPFGSCGTGTSGTSSYPTTSDGHNYTFSVRAVSSSGTSPAETYKWKYLAPPPAPSITAHPSDPSNNNKPSFSFSDTQSGVTYKCSLDGGGFGGCSSPKTFGGQPDGSHTFQVEAVGANNGVSDPASFTWTIDTKAPKVELGFPVDHGLYTGMSVYPDQSWNLGCATPGFCGSATDDGTSVSSVQLSLQQVATGLYWNGSSWVAGQTWVSVPGTSNWNKPYAITAFPADGDFLVSARATDAAGNASDGKGKAQSLFTIDRVNPPPATFKKTDIKHDHAHFEYSDSEKGVKFQCSSDSSGYADCGPTFDLGHLAAGVHQFCVRAVDQAGNASMPVCFTWQVGNAGLDFHVTGSPLSGSYLYPGAPDVPVNLVFTNNSPVTVQVTDVTTTVDSITPAGAGPCAASDFSVPADLSATPTIAAHTTVSLQDLGIDQSQWPQLRMGDNGNQDGCRDATVNLKFAWGVAG